MDNRTKFIPFYILEVLAQYSDEQHPLLISEIKSKVNGILGYELIKKNQTIKANIQGINEIHLEMGKEEPIVIMEGDKQNQRTYNTRAYMIQRVFEMGELILFYNIIKNSTGIGEKEVNSLCEKLIQPYSKYQKDELAREAFLSDGTSKTQNRETYINLEHINKALKGHQVVSFMYYHYSLTKELVPKKDIKDRYEVYPYGLLWSYGSCFMIGYSLKENKLRTYRVDKMKDIKEIDRQLPEEKKVIDVKRLVRNAAYMYTSEEKINAHLRCKNKMLSAVIERYGDCIVAPDPNDKDFIQCRIPNTTFEGITRWVLEHIEECEVISPSALRKNIYTILQQAANKHRCE